jgi:hypothetical protein
MMRLYIPRVVPRGTLGSERNAARMARIRPDRDPERRANPAKIPRIPQTVDIATRSPYTK